jgi:lysozyme family protein
MSRFDDCLAIIFEEEGGISDNPADHGGLTNYGVAQATYDDWRVKQGLPQQPVTMITRDEAASLYLTEYWQPNSCDQLPQPVDLCMFDTDVNSGDGRGAKLLQAVLGVAQDGDIGPATLAAVAAQDPLTLAANYLDARQAFDREICANNPSQLMFLNGWKNRINGLRKFCGAAVQP